jgi:hypothetical protein
VNSPFVSALEIYRAHRELDSLIHVLASKESEVEGSFLDLAEEQTEQADECVCLFVSLFLSLHISEGLSLEGALEGVEEGISRHFGASNLPLSPSKELAV